MARHTTFRFCLDPTVEQTVTLARHVGAARFAYNQCLRLHLDARERHRALDRRGGDADAVDQARDRVPWSRFSLINAYNQWKVSKAAGRRFLVTGDGVAEVDVTGLAWRGEVSAQVFEQATITRGVRRWWVSITVEAADLHPAVQHPARSVSDKTGWVGVDRGLRALVVAGKRDGSETLRVEAPKTLATGLLQQRRLARAVSRKKRGSANQRKARTRLARHHLRVRDTRQHFLHQVSNQLVQTHDRLVLEDLNITGIMSNHRLARAVGDAAWGELARQITYKQHWRHGQIVVVDRWFASSKTCSSCGRFRKDLTLKERTFKCHSCGHVMDRDLNAAANLAAWAEDHTPAVVDGGGRGGARDGDRQAAGPDINACRRDSTGPHTRVSETSPDDAGTPTQAAPAA